MFDIKITGTYILSRYSCHSVHSVYVLYNMSIYLQLCFFALIVCCMHVTKDTQHYTHTQPRMTRKTNVA